MYNGEGRTDCDEAISTSNYYKHRKKYKRGDVTIGQQFFESDIFELLNTSLH